MKENTLLVIQNTNIADGWNIMNGISANGIHMKNFWIWSRTNMSVETQRRVVIYSIVESE